ncbi:hypothetical protein Tco_1372639 [Tanacetum coccineum]
MIKRLIGLSIGPNPLGPNNWTKIVMENPNSPNKPNHVEDAHDPNEMVDIPDDEELVDYDGDEEEEPEEEPKKT